MCISCWTIRKILLSIFYWTRAIYSMILVLLIVVCVLCVCFIYSHFVHLLLDLWTYKLYVLLLSLPTYSPCLLALLTCIIAVARTFELSYSKYGFSLLMLVLSLIVPRWILTVPLQNTSVIVYGYLFLSSALRFLPSRIIRTLFRIL